MMCLIVLASVLYGELGGLVMPSAGVELSVCPCRLGWKELMPTRHHPVLSEHPGPQMPTSAPVHCLKPPCLPQLPQPGLCQAANCALSFRLGSQLTGWEEAIGLFGSEGALGVLCFSRAAAPSTP